MIYVATVDAAEFEALTTEKLACKIADHFAERNQAEDADPETGRISSPEAQKLAIVQGDDETSLGAQDLALLNSRIDTLFQEALDDAENEASYEDDNRTHSGRI